MENNGYVDERDYRRELKPRFEEMLENEVPHFKRVIRPDEYNELFCYYRNAQMYREAAEKDMERGAIESAQKNNNRAINEENCIRSVLKQIKNRANETLNVFGGRAHHK